MLRILLASLFIVSTVLYVTAQPLSQREACSRFSSAVVRIDAGGHSLGTGFLISADGFIFTAGHVITNETTGQYFSSIEVVMPDGSPQLAKVAVSMTANSIGQDYAILKVESKSSLPFLLIGSISEGAVGSDITIIGFPFSALTIQDQRVFTKFCLSGTVAASDLVTRPVDGISRVNGSDVPIKVDVKVEVVYFQGPSVKGIPGGPIISRDTGHVIGIETQKLTGIGPALNELREKGKHTGIAFSGIGDPGLAFVQVIDVLDEQLANGLGAATGIDDPAHALNMSKRKK